MTMLRGSTSTGSLNTKSKRADVDQNNIVHACVTSRDSVLDGRTVRDGPVGVDTLGRFLSEVVLEELLNLQIRNTNRTEDDFVDILLLNVGVGFKVWRKRSVLNSSNLRVSEKSFPSSKL